MTLGAPRGRFATRRRARRWSFVAIVALAGACSSSTPDQGFISLGRDTGEGGTGAFGAGPSISGAYATGAGPTGTSTDGEAGTAGTAISTGGTAGDVNGGTSTGANGGTASGDGGTSTGAEGGAGDQGGTDASGGTAGDANGGTSTGGEGNTCGSGSLPTDPGGLEACERVGSGIGRVCLPDGRVHYCGERWGGAIEECEPGTCATGCCHASSDPCPLLPNVSDCVGDCGAIGSCTEAPIVNLDTSQNGFHFVRVGGSNTASLECGARTVRYFEIFAIGPSSRVTVSPPWQLSGMLSCGPALGQCMVTPSGMQFIVVMTDVDAPPPRNVVIEAQSDGATCP